MKVKMAKDAKDVKGLKSLVRSVPHSWSVPKNRGDKTYLVNAK